MDARELRIGNYVDRVDCICTVESLDRNGATLTPLDSTYDLDKRNGINPIPLTEEWLNKFGFDLYEGGYSVDNEYEKHKIYYIGDHLHDGYSIHFASCTYGGEREDTIDFYKGFDYLTDCSYVHKLQNLYYALTGTELEIK